MSKQSVFCGISVRPGVLLALGFLLLLILWLLRSWLWILLYAYLGLIILAGLVTLVLIVRRALIKICWKSQADPKGVGSDGHPKSGPVYVPPTIYKRPDPLLYSQGWLLARGLAVTWDNRDISVFQLLGPGIPPKLVPPHALLPNHPHLIRARVWNGSTEAPAVNLLVRFYYLTFGIGTVQTFIGQTIVPSLPVKGAMGLPSLAEMPWTTPATAGHYCVRVQLVWTDDADQGNNLGQTNLDVKALNSPNATFSFPIRNDGVLAARLRLTTDAYHLPPLEVCEDNTTARLSRNRLQRHLPESNLLPTGWNVEVTGLPDRPIAAGEEHPVTVKVIAADGFTGALDINVNAFDGTRLVGGVTLRVHS